MGDRGRKVEALRHNVKETVMSTRRAEIGYKTSYEASSGRGRGVAWSTCEPRERN